MKMNRFGYLDAELFTNKCCYIGLLLHIEQNMNYLLTFSVFILMRKLRHNLLYFASLPVIIQVTFKKKKIPIQFLYFTREKKIYKIKKSFFSL